MPETTGQPHKLFVGVDIAAATATVAWQTPGGPVARPLTIDQTPQGYTRLQQRLLALGYPPAEILVVMEATGSYWMSLATWLVQAGSAVSVINPAQAHHFAKALLKRAKTDAIDAHTLTRLAALLQSALWTPPAGDLHGAAAALGPARESDRPAATGAQPVARPAAAADGDCGGAAADGTVDRDVHGADHGPGS